METQTLLALPIVLALEPVAGEPPARMTLSRDEAAELAERVAADLHTLVPQVDAARLALAGALFDQVELLRPGFPVWTTLDELARRVPRGQLDNVVAFGSHDGHMPAQPLEPSPIFADGPMRLLPMSLLAPVALAEELSEQLEIQLVGRGEASAPTADWLMRTLGIRLEHVRYLSRNDLLALTCVQYEHVNLAPLWTLLETALLTPERAESTMSARGLTLRYEHGNVLAQSPSQWLAAQTGDASERAHALAGIVFELRQYAALLAAHQLPLLLQADVGGPVEADAGYLLETLAAAGPGHEPPTLFAHEAAGLGVIAITVAQRGGGGVRVLAHGYPLRPSALGPLLALLADRHGIAADLHALGRVVLDEHGQLGAPANTLH
ncbi:hypothetical protein EAH75_14155 [Rhodanobacter glycinis]|uniref:Uncharacterized protein n=1 Tax=Rhodanobacter glycinis TaxID=582702 RepID=A0A502FB39_9GAMM|nr:hypothetical protein [Rhodanobacter glycinis]TPG09697.1 hypothetical protein EAH88_08435 [Rhodanobacter glycinis]TPG46600.1 hypothetical protein EAH75_14155 [Rhodanobacter glycinis]